MELFDSGFGLLPDARGVSRLEASWAAFCMALGVDGGPAADGANLARALARRPECAPVAAATLAEVVGGAGADSSAERLLQEADALIGALPPASLERVLASMSVRERRSFLADAIPALPAGTVLLLCVAAGASFGQPLSPPLLRLLQKLRHEAATLPPPLDARADQSFRGLVSHMVGSWVERTVEADAGDLAALFATPAAQHAVTRVTPEPVRVVQLALESGAIGNVVWSAVAEQTRTESGMRSLLEMLKRTGTGADAGAAIIAHLATPGRLAMLLQEDPVDFAAVDLMIESMGSAAARPLIDALVDARQRTTRREIMDRLVQLGPEIGPCVQERLNDERWYVVRNMIALLREAGCSVEYVPVERFRRHADGRVRREALQLQLDNEAAREEALVEALADTDRHVLRTALQAARSGLPERAVPILARRATDSDFPPEFRVISLYLLGRSRAAPALDALLAFAGGGRTLLGKPKLAPRSPEMLAALGGLARSWAGDRRAAALLEVARASKDEQILNALRSTPQAS